MVLHRRRASITICGPHRAEQGEQRHGNQVVAGSCCAVLCLWSLASRDSRILSLAGSGRPGSARSRMRALYRLAPRPNTLHWPGQLSALAVWPTHRMCACRARPCARPSTRARSRGGAGPARAWQPPRQRRRRLRWRPARAARTPRTASRPQRPPGDPPAFCASACARAPASCCEAEAAASAPCQGASCCLVLFAWVARLVRVTPGSDTYISVAYAMRESSWLVFVCACNSLTSFLCCYVIGRYFVRARQPVGVWVCLLQRHTGTAGVSARYGVSEQSGLCAVVRVLPFSAVYVQCGFVDLQEEWG